MNRIFNVLFKRNDTDILGNIPLNISGKLFTSPMPFSEHDPGNRLIKIYIENQIEHVFPLITDSEIKNKARRDLIREYEKRGITCSRYIMQDLQAPSVDMIKNLVHEACGRLKNNQRILVHCYAGIGRTALAVSCITMAIEGLAMHEALTHVKANIRANFTAEQINLIEEFGKHLDVITPIRPSIGP